MEQSAREERYLRRQRLQEERLRLQEEIETDRERLDTLSRLVESRRSSSVNLSIADMSLTHIVRRCSGWGSEY